MNRINEKEIEKIKFSALLHDVGKIGIPDKVLLKPDRLDPKEFATMKTHAYRGKKVIDSIISNFSSCRINTCICIITICIVCNIAGWLYGCGLTYIFGTRILSNSVSVHMMT